MYDEARELAAQGDTEPVCKARSLAIGDRLDTDIEAGNRGGYDSLAVLTGVTNPTELMCAPKHLRGLNEAYPRIDVDEAGTRATCAQAQASLTHRRLTVNDPNDVNALRAACALTWQAADSGQDVAAFALPEFSLGE